MIAKNEKRNNLGSIDILIIIDCSLIDPVDRLCIHMMFRPEWPNGFCNMSTELIRLACLQPYLSSKKISNCENDQSRRFY
jgi:hypothetical protein